MDADTDLFKDNTIHHWRVHSIKSSSHCVVRFGDEFLAHLNDKTMEIDCDDSGTRDERVCSPHLNLFKMFVHLNRLFLKGPVRQTFN